MSERNDHQTKKFAVRELQRLNFGDTSKFIKDWNPEISNRNKGMKLKRLQSYKDSANIKRFCPNDNSDKPKFDNCDCLVKDCEGCHFPCTKCESPKCGHKCRRDRRWKYSSIEIEGTDRIIVPTEIKEMKE